eukprot:CAMPEP_0170575496 /NCGR_PEP_ID=MMETSP0224-20130122/3893_1 /TAXON_ID=285029 /ORGANISM="Togula jolla, Strain CCCM 725" /LENGTH=44 /DNA_ID= /DNA_START= /DNA_END= /DNA_ORIENTATION=
MVPKHCENLVWEGLREVTDKLQHLAPIGPLVNIVPQENEGLPTP